MPPVQTLLQAHNVPLHLHTAACQVGWECSTRCCSARCTPLTSSFPPSFCLPAGCCRSCKLSCFLLRCWLQLQRSRLNNPSNLFCSPLSFFLQAWTRSTRSPVRAPPPAAPCATKPAAGLAPPCWCKTPRALPGVPSTEPTVCCRPAATKQLLLQPPQPSWRPTHGAEASALAVAGPCRRSRGITWQQQPPRQ